MHPEKLMQDHLPEANEFFIAIENGGIVGCCALEIYSKRLAEVRSLSVDQKHQGRGIAASLIRHCLRLARQKNIYEVIAITGAQPLFEKFGFSTFHKERFAMLKFMK
jgi:amino-acid N-acetyltransferase